MSDFISGIEGHWVGFIILVLVCLNFALGAVHSILGKIKDLTDSKGDDKAFEIIGKIISIIQKIIDFASGNKEHK